MQHRATRQRRLELGATLMIAGLVLLAWVAWSTHLAEKVELWLHGQQPIQFYLRLDGDLLDDYTRVFGVAHNAGDRVATTREALDHGADVIEIDVISVGDALYAAHEAPPWFVFGGIYRGPRLESAWSVASDARAVALDLKERTPHFINLVVQFLNRLPEREVIVTTSHRGTHEALRDRAPHAYRFLTISTRDELNALYEDPELVELIDGVSIRETLLDEESAVWLDQQGLIVLAWTVNDIGRMNALVRLGVHGITTDNLAIMELLGGQDREETLLTYAAAGRAEEQVFP